MRDILAITKALADEKRLRMLLALRGRQLCLCQLEALVDLAPSTTSKHMSILRQAGLVEGHKTGRWVYYRLAGEGGSLAVRSALAWIESSLADDPCIHADVKRLQHILAAIPGDTCTGPSCPPGACRDVDCAACPEPNGVESGVSQP